jgi:hypothetical protein
LLSASHKSLPNFCPDDTIIVKIGERVVELAGDRDQQRIRVFAF